MPATYAPLPSKFEAGTPDIAAVVAFKTAIDYLDGIGMEAICSHEHDLLVYSHANDPHRLHFSGRDGQQQVLEIRALMQSNDGQIIRAAALEGLGILIQPNYIIYDDIVAGRLVPLLDDWDLPRLTINIAYQGRKHLPARVRVFIDFLVQHFEEMDYERKWTQ